MVEGVARELDRLGVDMPNAVDDDAPVPLERGDLAHSEVRRFIRANLELGMRGNRGPHAVAASSEAHGLSRAQELEDDSGGPVYRVSVGQGAPVPLEVCPSKYVMEKLN
jgi:hypothetical protein